MTRSARLAASLLLASASAPVWAQADPARLDDFAVAAPTDNASRVEQLSPARDAVAGSPRPHERTIAPAGPPAPPSAALPQISAPGQAAEPVQLSRPGSRPDEGRAAVSSTADSRPQGVTRIQGHDRCDPQLAKEELARCQRILELRAQEFSAPQAPKLSAEQQLLAERRAAEEREAGSLAGRLRLASRDEPDADLQSNQELASIYLERSRPPAPDTSAPADDQKAATNATQAQILEALQVQTGGAPPPTQ
jgi:hypothetical protein